MKILYLDCGMGVAGDMLAAALLELLPDREAVLKELNHIGLPEVTIAAHKSVKCGITGTGISVSIRGVEEESMDGHEQDHEGKHLHEYGHSHGHEQDHEGEHPHEYGHSHTHPHPHSHRSLAGIREILEGLRLPEKVKEDVLAVYLLIAEAESRVHGMPVTQIHFHEVGELDAIADIVAVCLLMHRLAPDRVMVSPVHTGSGQVRCAHGILPVPAPATALLLKGLDVYGGRIRGELCTPTGAALVRYFADSCGEMPVMRIREIGYGMGKKDFEAANCVRALWGEASEEKEQVWELACNLDDMTGEELGFAMEQLLEAGALEVYTTAAGMKKNRPGVVLTMICRAEHKEKLIRLMFVHTTTLGIREKMLERVVLDRSIEACETPYGTVRKKISAGYGCSRAKWEYEDVAGIARRQGISLREVEGLLENCRPADRKYYSED